MKRRAFLGNAGFLPLQFVGVTTMNRLLRLTTLSGTPEWRHFTG